MPKKWLKIKIKNAIFCSFWFFLFKQQSAAKTILVPKKKLRKAERRRSECGGGWGECFIFLKNRWIVFLY